MIVCCLGSRVAKVFLGFKSLLNVEQKELIKKYIFPYKSISVQQQRISDQQQTISDKQQTISQQHQTITEQKRQTLTGFSCY